jgi:hypothetical protein
MVRHGTTGRALDQNVAELNNPDERVAKRHWQIVLSHRAVKSAFKRGSNDPMLARGGRSDGQIFDRRIGSFGIPRWQLQNSLHRIPMTQNAERFGECALPNDSIRPLQGRAVSIDELAIGFGDIKKLAVEHHCLVVVGLSETRYDQIA